MTDREDLNESRKALAEAEASRAATDAAVRVVTSAREGIHRLVERNGYVSRFRDMIQGNTNEPSKHAV